MGARTLAHMRFVRVDEWMDRCAGRWVGRCVNGWIEEQMER